MRAGPDEAERLSAIVKIVWPEHTLEELTKIIEHYINPEDSAVFAKAVNGRYIGVALCSLRHDYVEGCETSPVGYLEGLCVSAGYRRRGLAKELLSECEKWAKDKGCTEFASDCEISNTESLCFHLSAGFTEENRIICFKKTL